MIARYLLLPSFLLELALAASSSYSNSSVSESTSTIEITSFLTVTAPPPLGTGIQNANGTGLDYASSCNQAKQDWVDIRGQTFVFNSTFVTTTSQLNYTYTKSGWIETSGNTEVYTLCDGYPRMNASTEYKTIDETSTLTTFSTFTTVTEVYGNVSAPPCTIGPTECRFLNSEYNTSLSAYWNYYSQTRSDWTGQTTYPSVTQPSSPICGSPTLPPLTTTLGPAACMYNFATIQLLYWPVSTVGNHICGNNWTTVEATPTIPGQPNTAVGHNTTFTSPTVYMVMSGARELGKNFETGTAINGILPMPSDGVSSMCAQQGGGVGSPEPMDYADFDAPIPASKYRCQPACWTKPDYPQSKTNSDYNITATENLCSTIYDQVYKPALQVPIDEFKSFFSEHTGVGLQFGNRLCSFSPMAGGIFYDPPSALQQVQSAPGPTAPGGPGPTTPPAENPQTTPAAPGNTVPTALPQTTDGGNGSPQPTQPNSPTPSDGSNNDDDDDPADPDSPSDPGNNGGGDDNDDPSDPASPSDPGNNGGNSDGDNGGNNGGDNGGNNSGDDGGDDSGSDSPSNPSPTQDVGGIIASIIGADPEASPAPGGSGQEAGQDPADPSIPNDTSPSGSTSDDSTSDNPGSSDSSPNDSSPSDSSSDSSSNNDPSSDSNAAPAQGIILTDTSGQTVTAIRSGDDLVLPSATIAVGQGTSVAGIGSISVGSEGVEQNGQSIAYQTVAPSPSDAAGNDVYVVDGQTYTADSSSHVIVAPGVTLTAGGSAATVSGTTYSLAAPSSDGVEGELVVNGVTATASEGGSFTDSIGVPQQTANAASSFGVGCLHLSVAIGLVILGLM